MRCRRPPLSLHRYPEPKREGVKDVTVTESSVVGSLSMGIASVMSTLSSLSTMTSSPTIWSICLRCSGVTHPGPGRRPSPMRRRANAKDFDLANPGHVGGSAAWFDAARGGPAPPPSWGQRWDLRGVPGLAPGPRRRGLEAPPAASAQVHRPYLRIDPAPAPLPSWGSPFSRLA